MIAAAAQIVFPSINCNGSAFTELEIMPMLALDNLAAFSASNLIYCNLLHVIRLLSTMPPHLY